jgi:hypothetical protein
VQILVAEVVVPLTLAAAMLEVLAPVALES